MGSLCSNDPETNQDSVVATNMANDMKLDSKTYKILLLGTGGAGKSTFFKQLQNIHGTGFSHEERLSYKRHIHYQLIEQIQTLIAIANDYSEDFPEEYIDCRIADHLHEICDQILCLRADASLTCKTLEYDQINIETHERIELGQTHTPNAIHTNGQSTEEEKESLSTPLLPKKKFSSCNSSSAEVTFYTHNNSFSTSIDISNTDNNYDNESACRQIQMLWNDIGIQNTFIKRHRFGGITDSTAYFLDKIPVVCSVDYLPTFEDILLCRHRTTGIIERLFLIEDTRLKFVDVGGQFVERNKWIHCFQFVTAVIFVSSLAGYNEVMYEREHENVMHDSLNLFSEVCINEWFTKTSMVLFLNKSDIFQHKVCDLQIPITVCFPDYSGKCNYVDSLHYIQEEHMKRNKDKRRNIYTHVTCATDTTNVKRVFNDVQHMIVAKNLSMIGM